ncbi:phosphoribosyltransferase [Inquilinus limosus]|uniref:phosphoribosyltransferase n=1 Tax=Inquilinus limosus TaxID=171674 RepID=UPI00041EDAFF|nr:phosphoribosyltransferase family protein [Inquilinus limosus]
MIMSAMRFRDRTEAGRRLAEALARYRDARPIVLALPRGGVPVAFEVARALAAPLDVLLVRKIGAPGYPELGIGAVIDGKDPRVVLNDSVMREVAPAPGYVEAETERQLVEIERRRRLYRGGRPSPSVAGRTVILVDDGIATGGTVTAALQGLAAAQPARLVLAVPVAPPDVLQTLSQLADDVVCLSAPHFFGAVGRFYEDFSQTTDEEVIRLLAEAAAPPAAPAA